LVNKTGVSIHHIVNTVLFFPVAFILNEQARGMVNRWYARRCKFMKRSSGVNPALKHAGIKRIE
jgi:hypothetical protein